MFPIEISEKCRISYTDAIFKSQEHGMAMIGGLVTVVGGVSKTEFLASIEVLDHSPNSDAPLGFEWRVAAHSLTDPRYDFSFAVAPVSALKQEERLMDECIAEEVIAS